MEDLKENLEQNETEEEKKARIKAEKAAEAQAKKEAEAQAEAERLAKEAAEKAADPRANMTVQEYMNELVPIYLHYDGEKYKDDVEVTLNGKTWQIQRGVQLEVPRFVYDVVIAADRQKMEASRVSRRAEERFNTLANQNIL